MDVIKEAPEEKREKEVLAECIKMVDAEVKKLETIHQVKFYARIEPVGPPTVNLTLESIARRGFFQTERSFNGDIRKKLTDVFAVYQKICKDVGVLPLARITDFGARIEYTLTEEKRESLKTVTETPKEREKKDE